MIIKIVTIFPEIFPGYLSHSIIGKAYKKKIFDLEIIDLKKYAYKNKIIDDKIYGGGAGMLIRFDVLSKAIEANNINSNIIYPSPRGKILNNQIIDDLKIKLESEKELSFICGRYEGIDQRAIDFYNMQEISIGKYIISGGELSTMVIIDSIIRKIDNVLGNKESLADESFTGDFANCGEYDQYTRPYEYKNIKIPEILISGNHQKIKEFRLNNAKNYNK